MCLHIHLKIGDYLRFKFRVQVVIDYMDMRILNFSSEYLIKNKKMLSDYPFKDTKGHGKNWCDVAVSYCMKLHILKQILKIFFLQLILYFESRCTVQLFFPVFNRVDPDPQSCRIRIQIGSGSTTPVFRIRIRIRIQGCFGSGSGSRAF